MVKLLVKRNYESIRLIIQIKQRLMADKMVDTYNSNTINKMVPRIGLEPMTLSLKGICSTN